MFIVENVLSRAKDVLSRAGTCDNNVLAFQATFSSQCRNSIFILHRKHGI